jgi:hypothetical protein
MQLKFSKCVNFLYSFTDMDECGELHETPYLQAFHANTSYHLFRERVLALLASTLGILQADSFTRTFRFFVEQCRSSSRDFLA